MSGCYQIATLLYIFNRRDEVLLLHRAQEPNLGFWSPPGGKLNIVDGESPYECACREAEEEVGLQIEPSDLHLTGMITERGHSEKPHWLMFLFEVRTRVDALPADCREGQFGFFPAREILDLALPQTDREKIWPLFWQHRHGFFSARCQTFAEEANAWTDEESCPTHCKSRG